MRANLPRSLIAATFLFAVLALLTPDASPQTQGQKQVPKVGGGGASKTNPIRPKTATFPSKTGTKPATPPIQTKPGGGNTGANPMQPTASGSNPATLKKQGLPMTKAPQQPKGGGKN